MEMVRRGMPTASVTMVDAGPWGAFWEKVGNGTFRVDVLRSYLDSVPSDLADVKRFMEELAKQPADVDTAEVFVVLQAASFGGKAIWVDGSRWANTSFRDYWEPTETSSRRTPVNPMMPMPGTLLRRVEAVCEHMVGVSGVHGRVENVAPEPGSVVYFDPPYRGTTDYGHAVADVHSTVLSLAATCTVWVSEAEPVTGNAVRLDSGRRKGGISGERAVANEEWLSVASPDAHHVLVRPGDGHVQQQLF